MGNGGGFCAVRCFGRLSGGEGDTMRREVSCDSRLDRCLCGEREIIRER
jgi:hypothetical protein